MKKENLLLNRELSSEEKIIESKLCDFSGIKCLLEKWELDGITGNSATYLVEDVKSFTKDELIQFTFKNLETEVDVKNLFSSTRSHITIRFDYTFPN